MLFSTGSATRALAELKGAGDLIPNQAILINAIPLQETKARAKRQTASQYLKKLEEIGILESRKVGREMIYLHTALLKLLAEP